MAEPAASRVLQLMASDFLAAEREADALLAAGPNDPATLQLKAFLLNFRKDYAGAVRLLERAARARPADVQIRFNLAYCRLQSGAVRAAAEAFAQSPGFESALLAVLCRRWMGQPDAIPVPPADMPRSDAMLAAGFFAGDAAAVRDAGAKVETAARLVSWINRYDAPGWGLLDDKATLAEMLAAHDYPMAPQTWTRGRRPPAQATGPWIAKHARLYGGQSIAISRDVTALPQGPDWVVQRYIDNPMLCGKRKFHVRLYLAFAHGEAALFSDGIVRVAPGDYGADLGDPRRHITNTLRFASNEATRRETRVLTLRQLDLPAAVTEAMHRLARELARIVREVRVATAGLACEPSAVPPKLLGLDVLPDAGGRPWLLEIERYPALHGGSAAADAVNGSLFRSLAASLAGGAFAAEWMLFPASARESGRG